VVRDGPFKGLRYPEAESFGSVLAPKIVGSYEFELRHVLSEVAKAGYTEVVDIGCAEGYYAVGLARLLDSVHVYAFDINPVALALCSEMARVNGVSERVSVLGGCDRLGLLSLPLGARALIISDCEGFEGQIFDAGVAEAFARHDFLIEVHDFLDPEISSRLKGAFKATHDLEVIPSVDDLDKVRVYDFPVLEGLSAKERFEVLREGRPCRMEWFFFRSREVREPLINLSR
jgi:SAM-dependent methyltransferase